MTHTEGMPGNPHNKQAALDRAVEYKEARESIMDRLAGQYKAIQAQIITLREDLKKGTEHAAQQNNPGLDELALKIRQTILSQIENLEIEKEEIEEAIKGKGGDPSDYTLQ